MCYITESSIDNDERIADMYDRAPKCENCGHPHPDAQLMEYCLPTDLDDEPIREKVLCPDCIKSFVKQRIIFL